MSAHRNMMDEYLIELSKPRPSFGVQNQIIETHNEVTIIMNIRKCIDWDKPR